MAATLGCGGRVADAAQPPPMLVSAKGLGGSDMKAADWGRVQLGVDRPDCQG